MVLTVNSAKYGDFGKDKKIADVTEIVRKAIANPEQGGSVDLVVNNANLGGKDPAPGKPKELKVTYSKAYRDAPTEVTLKEGQALKLQGTPAPAPGNLEIKKATWGVLNDAKKSMDVTAIAQKDAANSNNNDMKLLARSDVFRKDPAPGVKKQLKVSYVDTRGGEVKESVVAEGATMNLKSAAAPVTADAPVAAEEAVPAPAPAPTEVAKEEVAPEEVAAVEEPAPTTTTSTEAEAEAPKAEEVAPAEEVATKEEEAQAPEGEQQQQQESSCGGEAEEWGQKCMPDGQFEGNTKGGIPHGWGVYTYNDGGRYEGNFVEGKYHGWGNRSFPDGSKYEGDFSEGEYHGQWCTFTTACGQVQHGEFQNGKFMGEEQQQQPEAQPCEGQQQQACEA